MNEPEAVRAMARSTSIAVIGVSEDPGKPSHYVSAYMQKHGATIYPVNPVIQSVLGAKSHPSLTELVASGVQPDVVNVFRLPRFIPALVDEMIALGLRNLWVQQGILHLEAAAKAEAAGIRVVMDRCLMVEHRQLVP